MIDDTKESYAGKMVSMIKVEQVEESESLTGDFLLIDKDGNSIEGGISS